ncbi:uL22 family ribosomal protein [Pseudonocardia endophytica]|uniref:50S ribosomal protein L22 n=1 Tax=Pseudonocardia endophytica TaxID=401976 RepID=A0A4V2PJ95_PSEEN|nr:uL22 family ribosomal protein [Pseudonocardia endophytica]TCK27626.1 ribosomal protein L22 [Pseudonocardia endophytica]
MNALDEQRPPAPDQRFLGRTSQARADQTTVRRALSSVSDMPADRAYAALQFSAGISCPVAARVLLEAMTTAERAGVASSDLVVSGFEVGDGETVTRVRRLAHGKADWISTQTTAVQVELSAPAAPPRRREADR